MSHTRRPFVLSETTKYTELGAYDGNGKREMFSARLRHVLKRETHVIVGDHEPELRADIRDNLAKHAWKLDTPIMSRDRATLERRIDGGETSVPRLIKMIDYGPGLVSREPPREMWDASILSGRP